MALDALGRLGFGFVEAGTVTPRPQAGNPRPRLFRLPEDNAVINRMGFNNAGLAAFLPRLAAADRRHIAIGANIGINKEGAVPQADYPALAAAVGATRRLHRHQHLLPQHPRPCAPCKAPPPWPPSWDAVQTPTPIFVKIAPDPRRGRSGGDRGKPVPRAASPD